MRRVAAALVALVALTASACNGDGTPPAPPPTTASPAAAPPTERVVGPLSDSDAAALATMNDRLKNYVGVHTKLESNLPRLPTDATPEQIDRNQRTLEQLVREARATAKLGDLFTPEAQPVIKRLLDTVFGGSDGQQLKSSIMDASPVGVKLVVNGPYPDTVPISTLPPQVLQTLPRLSEGMEYRFIGDNLIILDVHAHVIADFIENVLPKPRTP